MLRYMADCLCGKPVLAMQDRRMKRLFHTDCVYCGVAYTIETTQEWLDEIEQERLRKLNLPDKGEA